MEKYRRYLIFDNHDWQWDYPHDVDNYFFGFVQNFKKDTWKEAGKNERKRMLIIDINQDIINNFRSQSDMALFVLETLNNEIGTIYMH